MIRHQVLTAGKLIGSALLTGHLRGRLLRAQGLIFMLHRFRNPDLGISGMEPNWLRTALAYLRRQGHALVPLDQLLFGLRDNPSLVKGAIAFTIDDGYADQAQIGAPIFAEFDCPVTTFVTSGFLDRQLWFWWDRVSFVFARTTAERVRFRLDEHAFDYKFTNVLERQQALTEFTSRCKALPVAAKLGAIEILAAEAGVTLPESAPAEYAPMTWDELRACERRGMTFGPHTVTHPILARTSDSQSSFEITESWRRLRAEARSPLSIFCYPNGQRGDFGPREWATLEMMDFAAAVAGTPGYVHADGIRAGHHRYAIPRYALPEDVPDLAQLASGLERLRQLLVGTA